MSVGFLDVKSRDFNPMAVSGLTKEARDGVNTALKSLASWRNELADTNEKNGKRVTEQMAAAAKALGWPEQVVDAARTQLQSIRNPDKDDGPTAGRLGGADQLAQPNERFTIGHVVEIKSITGYWVESGEPPSTVDAVRGTMAASMGRRDWYLEQAPLSHRVVIV
jgi:hypothetical protein